MSTATETYDDLDDDFEKTATLPEPIGEFTWEIVSASSRSAPQTGRIITLTCQCISEEYGQFKQEKAFWLYKKAEDGSRVPDDGVIRDFKKHLVTMGMDPDQWSAAGRKWGEILPLALKALVGLRFKGKRTKSNPNKETGKVYVNFFVNQRVKGENEPDKFTLEDIEARATAFDDANRDPFGDSIPD